MKREPRPLTDDEQKRLAEQFRGILGSSVTSSALSNWESLQFPDIIANLHLYHRLFIALGLVTQLRGYAHDPHWLADLCSAEELEAALAVARDRRHV